jgi:glycosyltransferase involved in cell wall biosynthesis
VRAELARGGFAAHHLPLPVGPPGPHWSRRPAAEPLFVFAGRLARQKGIFELARAFARLRREIPTARLRFVGDGPDRAALERRIATLGIAAAVELDHWLPAAGVERRLADAWALVAPTIGPEPLGLVALEAIVRAVPVIATRNGGFVETVSDGESGLLVDDGDEEDLLRALRRVATRRDFSDQRVAAPLVARTRARHDPARHVADLRRILAAAAGAARGKAATAHGIP